MAHARPRHHHAPPPASAGRPKGTTGKRRASPGRAWGKSLDAAALGRVVLWLLLFGVYGPYIAFRALTNFRGYMDMPDKQLMVKTVGRGWARVLYVLGGLLLTVLGWFIYAGLFNRYSRFFAGVALWLIELLWRGPRYH